MQTMKQIPDRATEIIQNVTSECQKIIVGKSELIEDLLVALLSEGHILMEGVPGVAKTTMGKTFASVLGLDFKRLQGTPDVMPADIVGTHVFDTKSGNFRLEKGPIFTNILLIDEINRNTPKTNSAVLEALEEKQVTIEGETKSLPRPFMVIATQSPIEFHGVFPLPEVLIDRFLLSSKVGYPSAKEEVEITDRSQSESNRTKPLTSSEDIAYLINLRKSIYIAPQIRSYIVDLVHRTRQMEEIALGASPRASIALSKASCARALIKGRAYVLPDDVKQLAPSVLRHRISLSDAGPSDENSPEAVVNSLLEITPIPQREL